MNYWPPEVSSPEVRSRWRSRSPSESGSGSGSRSRSPEVSSPGGDSVAVARGRFGRGYGRGRGRGGGRDGRGRGRPGFVAWVSSPGGDSVAVARASSPQVRLPEVPQSPEVSSPGGNSVAVARGRFGRGRGCGHGRSGRGRGHGRSGRGGRGPGRPGFVAWVASPEVQSPEVRSPEVPLSPVVPSPAVRSPGVRSPEVSSPVTAVNKRVYVAVGNDMEESRLTLQWALENFEGDFRIIHVHSPSPDSPGRRYVSEVRDIQAMQEILDEYVRIFHQAQVSVEKRWVEMRDIGKGIVELIEQHAVTKLVMGAAADKHYIDGMTELKSTKAKFVDQHAHPSCHIWFICNGHLIHFREGDLSTIDMDVHSSWRLARSAAGTVQLKPRSPSLSSVHSPSYCSEKEDDIALIRYERGEASGRTLRSNLVSSYEEDHQLAVLPVPEDNGNEDLYEKLERAMAEVASAKREAYEELLRRQKAEKNAIEAYEELLRHQKAEKNAIEASRRAKVFENLYSEELRRRKELQEALAREKEGFESFKNRQAEELSVACNQRTLLESQTAGTTHMMQELPDKIASNEELLELRKKKREELRLHLENALKVNEELLENQAGEPSTSQRQQAIMEFSLSEIQEATDNFDPYLKIEEGDWGSIYRGFLHHTPVTVKMLHPDSSRGLSQYHREVEVVSKLRHPNLVALIGVCPDAWALIYEHLENGCLEDKFSSRNNSSPLSWQIRIRISIEICSALIFLHSCKPKSIIHGNLKPKNVLLDANLASKLKDLRIPQQSSSNGFAEDGIDSSEELSVESDVYSIGIILLQLLTGRSAPNLAEELQDALNEGNINDKLDQTAGDWPFFETIQLAQLALSCCEMDRSNRPDLKSEIWSVLDSIRDSCEAYAIPPSETGSNEPNEIPSFLLCPISHEIMEDPHVAADGFTYEAEAIRGWLDSGHDTSPMTNLQLPNSHLIPNRSLRSAIQEWVQNH